MNQEAELVFRRVQEILTENKFGYKVDNDHRYLSLPFGDEGWAYNVFVLCFSSYITIISRVISMRCDGDNSLLLKRLNEMNIDVPIGGYELNSGMVQFKIGLPLAEDLNNFLDSDQIMSSVLRAARAMYEMPEDVKLLLKSVR